MTPSIELQEIRWDKLVKEHDEWVAHNFPDEVGDVACSLIGMTEELGELARAHLKLNQGIRGSGDDHRLAAMDAIGDLTIYMLGVLSYLGRVPSDAIPPLRLSDQWWIMRTLAHEVGLVAINPTIYGCERVAYCLKKYSEARGWSYNLIVKQVWDQVKQRDWVKYPKDGLTE